MKRRRIGAFLSPAYVCRHGVRCRPLRWNVYRPCGKGCGVAEPERWWHRLGWRLTRRRYNPFGR